MSAISYLAELTIRLTTLAAGLPKDVATRHAAYVKAEQGADGGFGGRKGRSDPYYTSFALRALALLGQLDEPTAARAGEFLRGQLDRELPPVDFLALVIAALLVEMAAGVDVFEGTDGTRRQAVVDFTEQFRRDDGGYVKTQRAGQSSTYHTFLTAVCRQLVDAPLADQQRTIGFVLSRRRDDGGFVEIDAMRHSGTNPTAAAVGLLQILGGLDAAVQKAASRFLAGMQAEHGGLRANTRIIVADLLSTFTGLVTLMDADVLGAVDTAAALRFVRSLDRPGGGFRGGLWDDAVDVEYTFYGLGALALLTGS